MRHFAFTLIELLVIIGILAILMAVLLPALGMSRLEAKSGVCASNISQINNALFIYTNENGRLPFGFYTDVNISVPSDFCTGSKDDKGGWWWFNYLDGLCSKKNIKRSILQCPAKKINNRNLQKNILNGNYGVNLSICKMSAGNKKEFVGQPLSLDVKNSSQTLLILDSGYTIIGWYHAADIPPEALESTIMEDTAYVPGLKINKDRQLWKDGSQIYDAVYGRHPRKTVNVGYMDGHVAKNKADDLLVEKTTDSYKNLVPLWQPK